MADIWHKARKRLREFGLDEGNGLPKRVKTPTVLQMEAVECGAASLGIILGYYGRFIPLEELRTACGVSRDGSKASSILRAARQYGLTARGASKDPAQLKALQCPFIIHWNFYHFLVVEGFADGKVYLNDPASGPRVVSEEEFGYSFTGIVIFLSPGSDFKPGGRPFNLFDSLGERLNGLKAALVYILLICLLLVIPGFVVPAFTRVFVDNILVAGNKDWLGPLLGGMALVAVVQAILYYCRQYYLLRLETRLAISQSGRFLWHILRLPVDFFSQRYAGDLAMRVQINDRVAGLLSGQLAVALLDCLTLAVLFVIMLYYTIELTFITVVFVGLNVILLQYMARQRKDQNQRLLQERSKVTGVSMAGLQMVETLKAGGMEMDFFAKWAGYHTNLMNAEASFAVSTRVLEAAPVLVRGLAGAVILSVGAWEVLHAQLTVGTLMAFLSLVASFMGPVTSLMNLGGALQEVEGDMKRLDDVYRYPATVAESNWVPAELTKAKLSGRIELRNVTFGYSRLAPPLIEDFSLSILPGQRVALVGGSGSGKSTIAKLVAGLYEPWSGEIIFDGKRRSVIPPVVLTASVAVVDQDISLFEGTVKENISLWDDTLPEQDIIQAAKDACAHSFIMTKQNGYEYRISEGGSNFSGGERQRLEIARSLALNPTVLVFDEATSALDPLTEKRIDDSVRRRGCTCLLVAHRLSTIRDCDEIIVLANGKVVQRGTHQELVNIVGHYKQLIDAESA